MKKLLLLPLLLSAVLCYGAKRDSITIFSETMQKEIPCTIVTPDGMKGKEALPTLYMLHGYSSNHTEWVTGYDTEELVERLLIIAVLPDGEYDSWWLDSPFDPTMQYETFISKELVAYIDSHYPTRANPDGRAITGLSMGGHGALYNGIRNQDVFGAAGSMSGGVDIRPFPANWNIADHIGEMSEHPENWERFTVINQLHHLTPDRPMALIIDCGTEDFFYAVNEALHEKLTYLNIPHRYTTDHGAHVKSYWQREVHHQFHFFSEFFNKPPQEEAEK